jgi:L-amino acid N-acyltransferase YncA
LSSDRPGPRKAARAGQTGHPRHGGAPSPGEVTIRPMEDGDTPAIAAIFNHYVRRSFAAFPDRELDMPVIRELLEQVKAFGSFSVEIDRRVIGFGLIRPFYPFPNLMAAGEVSYFISPGYTGRGAGSRLLRVLEDRARELGMKSLIARVSSRNRRSIRFHRKNGFSPCGRIRGIGTKFGKPFDVVILQKCLRSRGDRSRRAPPGLPPPDGGAST